MLADLTPEQRQEMRQKAAEKREYDKAWARENLRDDFADRPFWRRLASKYGIRLPSWYVRNTRSIRRALRLLKLDGTWTRDQTGALSLKDLMDANPSWPSYAFIGLILETVYENDGRGDLPELDEQDLIGEEPEEEDEPEDDLIGFDDSDLQETVVLRLPADEDLI